MLKSHFHTSINEAGCDEAGRGPLAGPVFAAAVIFPPDYSNALLDDSKKLSENRRNILREQIERDSVAFSVAFCTNEEIDKYNILNASILAMHRALDGLSVRPNYIIVDGNKFKPYPTASPEVFLKTKFLKERNSDIFEQTDTERQVPFSTIVKGDGKFMSIAAASILAKTYRDAYMDLLHRAYPVYGWNTNRAYPVSAHYAAIRKHGITPFHRLSFRIETTAF
ncbi:MAG: ribonuclease HII [Bacteroidales bacterium]|jgi:ribonuclease HII|nr:ribonuclease HII [Bacteroidales bacterium]